MEESSNTENEENYFIGNDGKRKLFIQDIDAELRWFQNWFARTIEERDITQEEEIISYSIAFDLWESKDSQTSIIEVDSRYVSDQLKIAERELGKFYTSDNGENECVYNYQTVLRLVERQTDPESYWKMSNSRDLYERVSIATIGVDNKSKWRMVRGHIDPVSAMKFAPEILRRGIHESLTRFYIVPEALAIVDDEVNQDILDSVYFQGFRASLASRLGKAEILRRFAVLEAENYPKNENE